MLIAATHVTDNPAIMVMNLQQFQNFPLILVHIKWSVYKMPLMLELVNN